MLVNEVAELSLRSVTCTSSVHTFWRQRAGSLSPISRLDHVLVDRGVQGESRAVCIVGKAYDLHLPVVCKAHCAHAGVIPEPDFEMVRYAVPKADSPKWGEFANGVERRVVGGEDPIEAVHAAAAATFGHRGPGVALSRRIAQLEKTTQQLMQVMTGTARPRTKKNLGQRLGVTSEAGWRRQWVRVQGRWRKFHSGVENQLALHLHGLTENADPRLFWKEVRRCIRQRDPPPWSGRVRGKVVQGPSARDALAEVFAERWSQAGKGDAEGYRKLAREFRSSRERPVVLLRPRSLTGGGARRNPETQPRG